MSTKPCPLVVRFGRLGDMLLLQPLLRRLHVRYGKPCHLLAAGGGAGELYRGQSDVSDVIAIGSHHQPFPISPTQWQAVLALRGMKTPCAVYVCETRPRSVQRIRFLLKLAGIPDTHCVFLDDVPLAHDEHWIEHLLRLADTTPPAFDDGTINAAHSTSAVPGFSISREERAACDEWLARRGFADRPLVLLQAPNRRTQRWRTSRKMHDDDKSWPTQHWTALVAAIRARLPGARILLCGSPSEHAYLESMQRLMKQPHVEVVANELPLSRLKVLATRAHSMISVDTGPAHLAAAMGCPLVVMFGAVSPSHWLPRSRLPDTVRAVRALSAQGRIDAITPEQVIEAWLSLPPWKATTAKSMGKAPNAKRPRDAVPADSRVLADT
ncbi:glycosyltransferase family 9 protein [Dyella mobilis]|uniref:Glycosyltransferase family 9 protein n=1 Tax=Dyella mobilis TaxID=1849582 RepID=A0ABS2KGG9_9GAMM|nr:glycosyltransferase family 9 protein [Dyella mobilis]MBM7129473.1 glycosyltransferase family 9 protein [Dyella mobilis]GLQ98263.1 hypothetical protein GCM10007863_26830 [Dyella mobilis]